MVTIEQKLSVFNKLLQRSIADSFSKEMQHLREDYSKEMQKSKDAVDREFRQIEDKALRKAEKAKAEILYKSAMHQRKAYMLAKEELFSVMVGHLRSRVDKFIESDAYEVYLVSLAKQLSDSEKSTEKIRIYMTKADLKKHGEKVAAAMPDILKDKIDIEVADDQIIGGMILKNATSNTRIDLSIKTLLEESKPYMVQTFFQMMQSGKQKEL